MLEWPAVTAQVVTTGGDDDGAHVFVFQGAATADKRFGPFRKLAEIGAFLQELSGAERVGFEPDRTL